MPGRAHRTRSARPPGYRAAAVFGGAAGGAAAIAALGGIAFSPRVRRRLHQLRCRLLRPPSTVHELRIGRFPGCEAGAAASVGGVAGSVGCVLLVDVAVHGEAIALGARPREHRLELDRRVALLVRIQSHADDPVPVRQGFFQRRHRRFGAHVAKETHDELGADPEPVLRILLRLGNSTDHRVKGDAARGVRVRVEEHFGT